MNQQNPWNYRSNKNKTTLTLETIVPDANIADRLVHEFQDVQGVREVSYRKDQDGTPKIRILLSQEATPMAKQLLAHVGEYVQEAFSTIESGGFQTGQQGSRLVSGFTQQQSR